MIKVLFIEEVRIGSEEGSGGRGRVVFCYQIDWALARSAARSLSSWSYNYEIPEIDQLFWHSFDFQLMAATQTGVDGPSVTSHAVVVIDNGHVPVPILCLSMVGWIVRTWETLYSLMCVTPGLVHVSISERVDTIIGVSLVFNTRA